MTAGMTVYFRGADDVRLRKGTLLQQVGDCWQVRGCRTAARFNPPVHIIPVADIVLDHVPVRERTKRTERHGSGLSLPVAESLRRKEAATVNLGMTEFQVLQAQAIAETRRRILCRLAASNGIACTVEDFEFAELQAEYFAASLAALRRVAATADRAELDHFRATLEDPAADSRLKLTMARSGKTAAIRYLQQRSRYRRHHVCFDDIRSAI